MGKVARFRDAKEYGFVDNSEALFFCHDKK